MNLSPEITILTNTKTNIQFDFKENKSERTLKINEVK